MPKYFNDFREFCGMCLKIYVSTNISDNLIIYGFFLFNQGGFNRGLLPFPPCMVGFNGFHVMAAYAKFDFGSQASYIKKLRCRNEMLKNQMGVSYGGKDEI